MTETTLCVLPTLPCAPLSRDASLTPSSLNSADERRLGLGRLRRTAQEKGESRHCTCTPQCRPLTPAVPCSPSRRPPPRRLPPPQSPRRPPRPRPRRRARPPRARRRPHRSRRSTPTSSRATTRCVPLPAVFRQLSDSLADRSARRATGRHACAAEEDGRQGKGQVGERDLRQGASPPPLLLAASCRADPADPSSLTQLTQLEHVLLRPDTYIGSIEPITQPMWVYERERDKMVFRCASPSSCCSRRRPRSVADAPLPPPPQQQHDVRPGLLQDL